MELCWPVPLFLFVLWLACAASLPQPDAHFPAEYIDGVMTKTNTGFLHREGNSYRAIACHCSSGDLGACSPTKVYNALRLLLVASETTYTNIMLLHINFITDYNAWVLLVQLHTEGSPFPSMTGTYPPWKFPRFFFMVCILLIIHSSFSFVYVASEAVSHIVNFNIFHAPNPNLHTTQHSRISPLSENTTH